MVLGLTERPPPDPWRGRCADELLRRDRFREDPASIWAWIHSQRARWATTDPPEGYRALRRLGRRTPKLTILTHAVDGLHRVAGCKSSLELHGSLWRAQCVTCVRVWDDRRVKVRELPPRCPHCGGLARPDLVFFGEPLPPNLLDGARRAVCLADVVILAGANSMLYPTATLAALAAENGAYVIQLASGLDALSAFATRSLVGDALALLSTIIDVPETDYADSSIESMYQ